MIEIIALFFLCKKNGELAVQKGLSPVRWKWYTIAGWLIAEFTGLLLGMLLFGNANLYGLMAMGIVSAFGGYLYVKALLEKKPDTYDDDINKIGVSDLHPPPRRD
ncbi:hypothetical protein [Ferruginibacter sp.]|uniref:hypothetical protein n=1 Tax=Ferruginibacter sp. TaxID=1940288 RepID=UPI00265B1E95|nr:hypothetical protein [Ferruginibacter sp.]